MNPGTLKLSSELLGHSSDVRSIAVDEKNNIISGSRDKSVKLWAPDEQSPNYINCKSLSDHTSYVSSVTFLSKDKNGNQQIVSGGNDNTIRVYKDDATESIILKGHTGAVCCLAAGPMPGTLLSGSWDSTARLWTLSNKGEPTSVELKGHTAAVWAVAALLGGEGFMVTGSADKTIIVWSSTGDRLATLEGHTDCVRGLAPLPERTLLSCANDATIRQWDATGKCTRIFDGHTHYVYSISVHLSLGLFATAGEGGQVRVWQFSGPDEEPKCTDELMLPAQSAWDVAFLSNGDVVTGSSDGAVRIFSRDPERQAPEDVQNVYDAMVQSRQEAASQHLGGVKVTDLPGPEALLVPGRSEGQTRLIRETTGVCCYQWDKGNWQKVGDVMGAVGDNSEPTGAKKTYEGKEYDYVFSVDVEDGAPALKLPYNRGEDPWVIAQSFIHRHNLPQAYLEQVANFIVTNSRDAGEIQRNPGYCDPFTGGSRYVPGTGTAAANPQVAAGADPFTGSSAYTTKQATRTSSSTSVNPIGSESYVPFDSYVTFDHASRDVILEKLREFNQTVMDSSHKESDETLINVVRMTDSSQNPDPPAIDALCRLLTWPIEVRFPALDIARLAVRSGALCNSILPPDSRVWPDLVECLDLNHAIPANRVMALRIVSNCLSHTEGRALLKSSGALEASIICAGNLSAGGVALQVAVATLLLNASVTARACAEEKLALELCAAASNAMIWIVDPEAVFRLMLALGTLAASGQQPATLLRSNQHLKEKCSKISSGCGYNIDKVIKCSKEVVALLW